MHITKKNLKRLASLSALGAGALTIASADGDAGMIDYVDLSPGVTVSPFSGSYALNLVGSHGLSVQGRNYSSGGGSCSVPGCSEWSFINKVFVQPEGTVTLASSPRTFNKGQKWSAVRTANSHLTIGVNVIRSTRLGPGSFQRGSSNFPASFTNKYLLFRFPDPGNYIYGWLELSWDASKTTATLEGYAFDTSGAFIAAGDTGASSVPEPSSLELAGLSALALGAAGVRRWKAARKAA